MRKRIWKKILIGGNLPACPDGNPGWMYGAACHGTGFWYGGWSDGFPGGSMGVHLGDRFRRKYP